MSIETEISNHPRRTALAVVLRTLVLSAADERRTRLGDGLDELLAEHRLGPADGRAGEFDAIAAMRSLGDDKAPPEPDTRAALARLFAHGVADMVVGENLAADDARMSELVRNLGWLAAHTFLDVFPELDRVLGADHVDAIWDALRRRILAIDVEVSIGQRPEALVGLAALGGSASPLAMESVRRLAEALSDPSMKVLAAQLARQRKEPTRSEVEADPPSGEATGAHVEAAGSGEPEGEQIHEVDLEFVRRSFSARRAGVSGEHAPAPLGLWGLLIGAFSGLLAVRWLLHVGGTVLLAARRPAELRVDGSGITLSMRHELLGRTIRSREMVIPFTNLAVARREVRFPRIGLYAGLVALATGTLWGVRIAADGVWGRSPSLVALGFAIFGVGVALDMTLSSFGLGRGGKYTLVFVPRKGKTIALAVNDVHAADDALRAIADRSA